MGSPNINNIGHLFVAKEGLAPKANSAGSRNGTGIDLTGSTVNYPKSCTVIAHVGAATGSPTSFTYDLKLQHSTDNSSWSDLSGGAITQQTAAGLVELDYDLAAANRYVRVVETVAFVGGTSPTLPASCEVVFGGARSLPL